jgi:hypothetical protein
MKMRNLNKSNVLTSTEPINRTVKKQNVEKILLKRWVQYVPSSVKVEVLLLRNPSANETRGLLLNVEKILFKNMGTIRTQFCKSRSSFAP